MSQSIRLDIIKAYDDEQGVNGAIHSILGTLCEFYHWHDIQDKVQGISTKTGYRYYLGETDAEELTEATPVAIQAGTEVSGSISPTE